jgi:predicted metal-dependent hydrolase
VRPRPLRERPAHRFELDGETIAVRVRESRRARTARIIVGPRRPLELIVPRHVPASDIGLLLESRRSWIEARLAAARELAARPPRLGLERPGHVPLAGSLLPLERLNGRRAVAERVDGRLLVRGPDAGAPGAIERWYRREARERVLATAARKADRLGVAFRSVRIGDPRSRWGSCSSRGNLSFSWRLVLAPPEVLGYVVVHELLHLREPNHGTAFWRLVESAEPDWRAHAAWLREHGHELHEYRPGASLPGAGGPSGTGS